MSKRGSFFKIWSSRQCIVELLCLIKVVVIVICFGNQPIYDKAIQSYAICLICVIFGIRKQTVKITDAVSMSVSYSASVCLLLEGNKTPTLTQHRWFWQFVSLYQILHNLDKWHNSVWLCRIFTDYQNKLQWQQLWLSRIIQQYIAASFIFWTTCHASTRFIDVWNITAALQ